MTRRRNSVPFEIKLFASHLGLGVAGGWVRGRPRHISVEYQARREEAVNIK